MACRNFGLLFCFALFAAASAEETKAKVYPTDIISGTFELVYDIYAEGVNFADSLATKHGAYKKYQEIEDLVFSKVDFVKKSDIEAKVKLVKSHKMAVKAQLSELVQKAKVPLDTFAADLVAKFEKFAPSYKGAAPKTFVDLVLVMLYMLLVVYIVLKCVGKVLGIFLGLFCCICCCGCCRRGSRAAKTNGKHAKKNAEKQTAGKQPDGKAAPKGSAKKK